MKFKFSNGKHQYKGNRNDRAKRKSSKIYKGIHINNKELLDAFNKLDEEIMKTREIILKRIKKGTKAGEVTYSNQLDAYIPYSRENKRQILDKLESKGLIKKAVGRPGTGYKLCDTK
jgi:hypothetical protein